MNQSDGPLVFIPAAATPPPEGAFVVIVRTREELTRCLSEPAPGLDWLQVEGLLGDTEAWANAAVDGRPVPLDVIMSNPAEEFSLLYRLADVRLSREVRVTMPATPGFMKALRLAASLHLAVRLLPRQPDTATLTELTEAVTFYLHDSAVEAPIEPFHSLLAQMRGTAPPVTLWEILEEDPAAFVHLDGAGQPRQAADFVAQHVRRIVEQGGECATCPWIGMCAGYFKWPDASYSCAGVQRLIGYIESAAEEISQALAGLEGTSRQRTGKNAP